MSFAHAADPAPASPSTWAHRAPLVALALVGCAISVYLALYQLGVTRSVWDPVFGGGSQRVLTSWVSRALPVPDALLGAAAYGLDALLGACGGEDRWREAPRLVVAYGVVAAGLVLAGVLLIALQALVLQTGCALCLTSAAISFAIGWFARGEVGAALQHLRHPED